MYFDVIIRRLNKTPMRDAINRLFENCRFDISLIHKSDCNAISYKRYVIPWFK